MFIKFNFYDSIKYVIDSLYIENKIDHESVIIIPAFNKGIEDILKLKSLYINKFVLISKDKIDLKNNDDKIDVIYIPSNFKNEELLLMANDVKEEYPNSFILDLSSNQIYERYIAKGLCKDIYSSYKSIEKIYVPYVYGGLYNAIYKFFNLMTDIKVVLINYQKEELKTEIDYDEIIDSSVNINDTNNIIIII